MQQVVLFIRRKQIQLCQLQHFGTYVQFNNMTEDQQSEGDPIRYEIEIDEGGKVKLPQPTERDKDNPSSKFRYLKFDQILDELLPEDWYNTPDAACWVLNSKGKTGSPQLYKRARILSSCEGESNQNRVTVQYPKGSTYRVRKNMLLPVLEHSQNLILVTSETTDYRRTAIVQTLATDHFIEIGCDFGILVDSVDAATTFGVDKSPESIRIAKERYPNRDFLLSDVFESLDNIPNEEPLVVAIDINGNRMLPAVLKCIQLVLDNFSPRIVVVKSRELYAVMNNGGKLVEKENKETEQI